MLKFLLNLGFLLLGLCLYGQKNIQTIAQDLKEKGFYNVIVFEEEKTLYLSYENKLYLNETAAIKAAYSVIQPKIKSNITTLCIIITSNYIPISQVIIHGALSDKTTEWTHLRIENSIEIDESIWKKMKPQLSEKHPYNYDIAIYPEFKTQLGNFEDPWKFQFNLAPMLNLSLWKGMLLSAQVVFPLHNELRTYDGDYVRPGIIALSQSFRLPNNYFGVVSVGRFSLNRYGAHFNFRKYFAYPKLYVGIEASYTGKFAYREGSILTETLSNRHAICELGYFMPKYQMLFNVKYGQFLFGDVSWKVALERKFKNIDIAFFGVYSKGVKNIGIHLNIPIYPIQPKRLNIHPARTFQYEHVYSGHQYEGMLYQTNYSLRELDRLLLLNM